MLARPLKKATIYKAPRPRMTRSALGWLLLSRLLFPPLLVWDLAKFSMNWLFGGLVGQLVLLAQSQDYAERFKGFLDNEAEKINQEGSLEAERLVVITHDGASLDTIEIKTKKTVPLEEQQYIVHFLGTHACCEKMLKNAKEDAEALDCNVVQFNFRGVSQSSGRAHSKDDLVSDGIAQVQRLLDKGINPENITLKGFSLGASIATLVTKHFHDRGLKINIFNGCSFSTLTNFVVGQIRSAHWLHNGHQDTFFRKILGWIVKPIIMFALALTGWEIDAASAFRALPATHKEYMVIRSPKAERESKGDELADDAVITHYASLHADLKDERQEYKRKIDEALEALKIKSTHSMVGETLELASEHLKEAKASIKARKMVPTKSARSQDSHCDDPGTFKDRHQGHTGKEFFRGFFKQAQAHHQAERERQADSIRLGMSPASAA